MAKIQNISEIYPTLGFTEFDVQEKYRKSFNENELGSFTQCSCLNVWQKPQAYRNSVQAAGIFSALSQRLPLWSSLHRIFRQTAGGTYQRQHTLLDVVQNHDRSGLFHTNYKIVSAIRSEIVSLLAIDSLQRYWTHTGNHILRTFTCV